MTRPLYFDSAATSPCCEEAIQKMAPFNRESFGHPSSAHVLGQQAAAATHEARLYFARIFRVEPEHVIFTGSGTESDNLAVQGIALANLSKRLASRDHTPSPRILCSAIEHSAVKKTVLGLQDLGFEPRLIPVNRAAQIDPSAFEGLLTSDTLLVSIHAVNNIVGSALPVSSLAEFVKARCPSAVFHTDAVQAFGRLEVPTAGSAVDLVSISSHKIEGPKGIGALVILNRKLARESRLLRPLIWGGGQENGLRAGTQNAGLIAGFHAAAQVTLAKRDRYNSHVRALREQLLSELTRNGLLSPDSRSPRAVCNLPEAPGTPGAGVPHILSLSFPGLEAGPLSRLLEERGCLVSTGSACSAGKPEPEPVLAAMGLPLAVQRSSLRISLSDRLSAVDIDTLARALLESVEQAERLTGKKTR